MAKQTMQGQHADVSVLFTVVLVAAMIGLLLFVIAISAHHGDRFHQECGRW
jgi:hypothetical protein